jgi:hypothetical protein
MEMAARWNREKWRVVKLTCKSNQEKMIIESIKSEYQRYKSLAEAAIAQVKDDDLHSETLAEKAKTFRLTEMNSH